MPKIRASDRDAYYESRRTELANVALRLWAQQGFDQTSVAAIAKEGGVAKGTFYLYFASKEALLEEVLQRNSLLPKIQTLVDDLQAKSFDQAVHGFVRGAWSHLCEHRDLVLIALRELPTHLEQAQHLMERVMVPANQVLADYLAARVDTEHAKQLSMIVSARGLLGMVVFVFLTQEILGAGRVLEVPEDEITATIANLFLYGVTTRAPDGDV